MEVLCADIGGTNARIALVEDLHVTQIRVYGTRQAKGAVSILRQFSRDTGKRLPPNACLAAAGVVTGNRVAGTNIHWDIDCGEIRSKLGLERCLVLNDFEAAAWGLLAVDEKNFVRLGGGKHEPLGTRAILGAGTGLGEAVLVHCGASWEVLRTEGGHASFSPRDDIGIELLSHLMKIYGHVSFERVVSGSGLGEIYSFFIRNDKKRMKAFTAIEAAQRPAHVTALAAEGDEVAGRAVDFFLGVYGEEASNLALKCLPSGGVYLTGGVTLHLLNFLPGSPFRKNFEDKGRMSAVLGRIPVFIVNEPLLGILGAAYRLTKSTP